MGDFFCFLRSDAGIVTQGDKTKVCEVEELTVPQGYQMLPSKHTIYWSSIFQYRGEVVREMETTYPNWIFYIDLIFGI